MAVPAYKNVSEEKRTIPTHDASVQLSPGQYVVGTFFSFLDDNENFEKTADYTTLSWVESLQIRYVYPEHLSNNDTIVLQTAVPITSIPDITGQSGKYLSNDGNALLWSSVSGGAASLDLTVSVLDAPYIITDDPSGSLFLNSGVDVITVTLPTPVVGLNYYLHNITANSFKFIVADVENEEIIGLNGSAGAQIWSTGQNATVHIVAIDTATWAVLTTAGTWTIEGVG